MALDAAPLIQIVRAFRRNRANAYGRLTLLALFGKKGRFVQSKVSIAQPKSEAESSSFWGMFGILYAIAAALYSVMRRAVGMVALPTRPYPLFDGLPETASSPSASLRKRRPALPAASTAIWRAHRSRAHPLRASPLRSPAGAPEFAFPKAIRATLYNPATTTQDVLSTSR